MYLADLVKMWLREALFVIGCAARPSTTISSASRYNNICNSFDTDVTRLNSFEVELILHSTCLTASHILIALSLRVLRDYRFITYQYQDARRVRLVDGL